MPFGDGTGPSGQGSGTGRRSSVGQRSNIGQGRGRQPQGFGLGPDGECVCPKCGAKAPHQRGLPCYEQKCPQCQSPMTRTK